MNNIPNQTNFQTALSGSRLHTPPIWLMRQAGRYLPEYRELRRQTETFMEFCFTPKLAVEATLQPIRRFGFDAAILFSDILVIPHSLGQTVSFESGFGPSLAPIQTESDMKRISEAPNFSMLDAVFEAVELIRKALPDDTSLIGFCGAPWTVASYMIAGQSTPDQKPARLFAYKFPGVFQDLIDRLTTGSIEYLCRQISSGADAVQIFDSWCGVLSGAEFEKWSYNPIVRIVRGVKKRHPDAKVIVFAKGAGANLLKFASVPEVDCVGLDTAVPVRWAAETLQSRVCVQGNLDPVALVAGGAALESAVDSIVSGFSHGPHIFNLGHGITPDTPLEHVEALIRRVRASG